MHSAVSCGSLNAHLSVRCQVKREVREILDVFKSGSLLSVEVQEKMRDVKNQLSMMVSRVASSQRVLAEITGDDEELALMNLTTLKNKPKLYKSVMTMWAHSFIGAYFNLSSL